MQPHSPILCNHFVFMLDNDQLVHGQNMLEQHYCHPKPVACPSPHDADAIVRESLLLWKLWPSPVGVFVASSWLNCREQTVHGCQLCSIVSAMPVPVFVASSRALTMRYLSRLRRQPRLNPSQNALNGRCGYVNYLYVADHASLDGSSPYLCFTMGRPSFLCQPPLLDNMCL